MKVVVIGGVAAGMAAAARLKRNLKDGVDIVVYEKGTAVSYGACGIPFYISNHIQMEEELIARTPEEFAASGIPVHTKHEVTNVDPATKTVTVKNLLTEEVFEDTYDKLIIGSGAGVRHFPPFNKTYSNVYEVRDVEDGNRVKNAMQNPEIQKIILVGAGFIGLEVAEACRKYGKEVTVVELAPRVLANMDPEVSEALGQELVANGVNLLTETAVKELIECDGVVSAAIVEKNGERSELPVDLVINCAGIAPATGFIQGIEKAGNGAIIVNEKMETSIPDIYAGGDCSIMKSGITGEYSYAPLGTNANKQGRIIADILAGLEPKPFKLLGSSALRLFGLDAAKVGLSEQECIRFGIKYKTNTITGNSYASYYGKEKLKIKVIYDPDTRKILGAATWGQGIVVPRANYYALAIYNEMTVDEMGFMDLCYSPPFSGVWDAALIASNTAK